jgi:Mce-associated membrane protein
MSRWTARLVATVAVLFAIAIVVLGGAAGYLYWNHVEIRAEEQAQAELPSLAATEIPLVFAYDYQTVERSLTDAYALLTPDFRREFEDRATKEIIPQARDRQVVSQANVVGTGMLAAHRNSASVLVFMNRTVTDKSKQPIYDGSRLQVDYQRINGKWLIEHIKPI